MLGLVRIKVRKINIFRVLYKFGEFVKIIEALFTLTGWGYFSFYPSHETPRRDPQLNPQSCVTPKKHLNSDWV